MKADADSILPIIITIAIIAISTLGSLRKRRLQKSQPQAPSRTTGEDFVEEEPEPPPRNVFEQLREQFAEQLNQASGTSPSWLGGSDPFGRMEQIMTDEQPVTESMEGESAEEMMDEEEQILEEIRKRQEPEPVSEKPVEEPIKTIVREVPQISGLFKGRGEIIKAIIYSEVFTRKY